MSKMSELHAHLQELADELGIEHAAELDDLRQLFARFMIGQGYRSIRQIETNVDLVVGFAAEAYGYDDLNVIEGELWMTALHGIGLSDLITFH